MCQNKCKVDPDTTKCRTSRVGAVIPGTSREMYYCGIDYAECRYAMPLGWDYICKHPDNDTFCSAEPVDTGLVQSNDLSDVTATETLSH